MIQTRNDIVAPNVQPIKGELAGKILSGVLVALFLLDGGMKLAKPAPVVEATTQLGFPEASILAIGLTLVISTLLYAFRRTSFFGAILLSAYLGGAVCTHVNAGHGAFEVIFPAFFGVLVWVGLGLREPRVRELIR